MSETGGVLSGGERWHVSCGRAEAFCDALPTSCVDLIVVDHPYHRVKDEDWDREHSTASDFVSWTTGMLRRYQRILKPNGSLYLFASPRMAARVEVATSEVFCVLNRVTWAKRQGRHRASEKEALRAFFPASEAIIFAEHHGADNAAKGAAGYVAKCDELRGFVFEPLRAYLDGERERAGLSRSECDGVLGNQMSGHYFSRSQWTLPTRQNYERLRAAFNARGGEFLRREYEDLRREYEDLRREYEDLRREYEDLRREYEDLRRPFSVTAEVPYTDVWSFEVVNAYRGKHPCEKPESLAEHIIRTSSREGAVVLDCFSGSGTFPSVAVRLGRRALACDMDPRWVERTRERCRLAEAFGRSDGRPATELNGARQLSLFLGCVDKRRPDSQGEAA